MTVTASVCQSNQHKLARLGKRELDNGKRATGPSSPRSTSTAQMFFISDSRMLPTTSSPNELIFGRGDFCRTGKSATPPNFHGFCERRARCCLVGHCMRKNTEIVKCQWARSKHLVPKMATVDGLCVVPSRLSHAPRARFLSQPRLFIMTTYQKHGVLNTTGPSRK